jgi:inner membrane protein
MLLYLIAANAADLDFLPGLFVGNLSKFHHGPSHSIGFAILFGLVASLIFTKRLYAFAVGSGLYLSHILLDYLIQDPSPPYGVQLLWPFSHAYLMAPLVLFRPFNYRNSTTGAVAASIFTQHNLLTITVEVLYLLPVLCLVLIFRQAETLSSLKLMRSRRDSSSPDRN